MQFLDIGEVVERSGLPASTLRYYEKIGLITSTGRHGLRRQFADSVVLQLALVAMGKSAGLALSDIQRMFGKGGRHEVPRAELLARAENLERQISDLSALRDTMRHVAECRAPSHLECPTFQRLMRVAARRLRRKGSKG